jgi:hypothetical protein
MATTTNYSWTTPDDTDLVKDGAASIRTLGSSIDTSVKALSPGTTAGDVDYYTTSTAKARLGIGTAGQVLTVNSLATAPEWTTPASPAPASNTATVATSQTTTSTSYTDLATAGPSVTMTTGTKVLVIVSGYCNQMPQPGGRAYMDFAISGATTRSASDTTALLTRGDTNGDWWGRASVANRETVTAGSNTFTAKYKVSTSTGGWQDRSIIVIDLGS